MVAKPDQQCRPFCDEHLACKVRLDHLEEADKDQWKEINGMKRMAFTLLATALFNAIGIIVALAMLWARGHAPG